MPSVAGLVIVTDPVMVVDGDFYPDPDTYPSCWVRLFLDTDIITDDEYSPRSHFTPSRNTLLSCGFRVLPLIMNFLPFLILVTFNGLIIDADINTNGKFCPGQICCHCF